MQVSDVMTRNVISIAAGERKYQQRGRCRRLPPKVATLRICGLAEPRKASASAR
jgi:hypothetical protein